MLKDILIHFVGGRTRTLTGNTDEQVKRFVSGWNGVRREGPIFHSIVGANGCSVLYNAANVLEIEIVPSLASGESAAEGH